MYISIVCFVYFFVLSTFVLNKRYINASSNRYELCRNMWWLPHETFYLGVKLAISNRSRWSARFVSRQIATSVGMLGLCKAVTPLLKRHSNLPRPSRGHFLRGLCPGGILSVSPRGEVSNSQIRGKCQHFNTGCSKATSRLFGAFGEWDVQRRQKQR